MKKTPRFFSIIRFVFLVASSLQFRTTSGSARTQIVVKEIAENNTNILLSNYFTVTNSISTQITLFGYGLAAYGVGPGRIYGFGQCYGDLSGPDDCSLCYSEARTLLLQGFLNTSGRVYLDRCFLRVDKYIFFEEYRGIDDKIMCGNATRKGSKFRISARHAVLDAADKATKNGGYSKQELPRYRDESVYVLANCWKTLSFNNCKACLHNASATLLGCLPWSEGRALYTGCFMRYSDQNFLDDEGGRRKVMTVAKVIAVVSSLAVMVVGTVLGVIMWKNKRIQNNRRVTNHHETFGTKLEQCLNFTYSILESATGSFNKVNKIGQGGFGTVYKGVLADGKEIAVKKLSVNRNKTGDFCNEVKLISSMEHKNLVRLLGSSCSGAESFLVYEYLSNTSLDRFLFDSTRGKSLSWSCRFEIIKGAAEGLVYLHENPMNKIIHRDIKASNILLDCKYQAKIADFGLARSFEEDKSRSSTAIAGTRGYMAPEYLARGQLTEKADVYSYGVLLIEIVTGRQNNMSEPENYLDNLVTAAWKHFQRGTVEELLDTNITLDDYCNDNIRQEISRVVHVALLCVQEVSSLRPTMSRALYLLLNKDESLPAPTHPPFTDDRSRNMVPIVQEDDPNQPLSAGTSSSIATIQNTSFYPR